MLSDLPSQTDPRVLVDFRTSDDAGVYAWESGPALVQTVDFFTPIVDDPYLYGQIAAANSVSDVYAMGGRPLSALSVAGFPKGFPQAWIAAILAGGFAKVREAGALVAGGHTVQTQEAQFGFAVTGLVERARLASNSGARAGDLVYLTKPLGMGAMTTAAKRGKIGWQELLPAAEQMATLNAAAASAMNAVGAHACTDVTGYGLVGHAHNVARASGVAIRFELGRLPIFPGARELAARGLLSGGAARGRAALVERVRIAAGLDEALVNLAFDAETSGGLLIFVAPAVARELEHELAARELPVARVGECLPPGAAAIELC